MDSFSWPLVRDAGRLLLLQNRVLPAVGKRLIRRGADSGWRLDRTDLERVPATAEHASLTPVREAWGRLSHPSHDAETLAALVLVLCSSSSTGARCASPLPTRRGTDMRPWLSDALTVAALVRALSGFMPRSLNLLAGHRWLPLEALAALAPKVAEFDLFILTRCRQRVGVLGADATTRLSRELLALAPQGRSWIEARAAAEAVESLQVDVLADGPGLAARVWTLSGSAWLREVAAMECDQRAAVLRLLVETKAAAKAPPSDVRRVFTTLHHVGKRERHAKDLRWIMKGLQRGASAGYLASALRVANKCTNGDVSELDEAPETHWAMPSHLFIWLFERTSEYRLRKTWRACSRVPGLVKAIAPLESVGWLPKRVVETLVTTLISLAERKAGEPRLAIGDFKRLSAAIIATARRLGLSRGENWIETLEEFSWVKRPLSAEGCGQAIILSLRLEKLLGGAACDIARVLRAMIDVKGEELLGPIARLPDQWCRRIAEASSSWTRLDQACWGMRKLDRQSLEMLWSSCLLFPARWFILMEEIECVPRARVRSIFQSAAEHPLFACSPQPDQPQRALVLIDSIREERCRANPVSTRLREHGAGARVLPAHLLKHDLAMLRRGWIEAQLHLVEELVQADIWRAFPGLKPDAGITEHSLKLALTVDGNERPLRRLLRAWARGELDWVVRHPINHRWRSMLGEVRAERWREGIAASRTLPTLGEVILAPEHDPQEVLRMGSAVGSCLAVGGCNSHAAAANALDANKRVVFARTPAGKVIGRQLLAISEEGRLVCFTPYPTTLRGPVLEFFEDYDHVLAGHLGLPLHRSGDYTIEPLVAKEWYDDGLWERFEWAA